VLTLFSNHTKMDEHWGKAQRVRKKTERAVLTEMGKTDEMFCGIFSFISVQKEIRIPGAKCRRRKRRGGGREGPYERLSKD